MRNIISLVAALSLVACGDGAGELFPEAPTDAGAELGTVEQGFTVRPGETASGRTWGVRQNYHNACVNSGSSFNCYFFSTTAVGQGENRIKYALVDNMPNDYWASSEASAFVSDINAFQASLNAMPNPEFVIVFEQVPAAQADVLIKPQTTAATGNTSSDYIGVQFDTSSCTGLIEQVEHVNSYFRCSKATIKFSPTELLSYSTSHGYPVLAQRRWVVNSALLGLIGIGRQTAHTNTATYPSFNPTTPGLVTNEEKCRLQTLSGVALWPGILYFQTSGTICPN